MRILLPVTLLIALTTSGCSSLRYATDLSELKSPGYAISYPAYEVLISTVVDDEAQRGRVNCYDDAGCIERLVASTRISPNSNRRLFVGVPMNERLTVEYGPSGHGVRGVGWETGVVPIDSDADGQGSQHRWNLRSLTDPSDPRLRLRLRVPLTLRLPIDSQVDKSHDVGGGNPDLSYSVTFHQRQKGVISVDDFLKRAQKTSDNLERFPWFPVAACRTATLTLKAKSSNGNQVEVAQVTLPVPDANHVLPVPFKRGSYIRLDPVCGVDSHIDHKRRSESK